MNVDSIAEKFFFTTIRVETIKHDGRRGTGTSFMFKYIHGTQQYHFLVTNKHVVKEAKGGILTFSLEQDGKPLLGQGHSLTIMENFESNWFGHPQTEIDVAITPLVPIYREIESRCGKPYPAKYRKYLSPYGSLSKQIRCA